MTDQGNSGLNNEPNIGLLYQRLSGLRQKRDVDWIMDLLPKQQFGTTADLCCGSGQLLASLLDGNYVDHLAIGIDRSSSMLAAAKEILAAYYPTKVTLYEADLLLDPEIPALFDLATMSSALHWFYPHELKVIQWIWKHLSSGGYFCLTTYHPSDFEGGYAGTDHLVLAAFKKLVLPEVFTGNVIPMGTRTRRSENIEKLLRSNFQLETIDTKTATMGVQNASEYIDYHRATFGDYYLRMVPDRLWDPFLQTMGETAMERMELFGYVTQMEVRAFVCRRT